MAKDPAFLFYPGDWLGGVMGMTFEEKGAYMEILMLQFNRGHMTEHMIRQTIGQLWINIQDKFVKDENGLWYNVRLEIEKKKREEFTKSRRNNVSGKNQYTKNDLKTEGHMTKHMENENRNINKDIIEVKKEIFNFKKSLINFGFDENLVSEWLQVRKNKKATNTETSFKKFISEIEKRNCNLNEILEIIVSNSWSGFSWAWIDNLKKQNLTNPPIKKEQMFGRMTQSTVEKNFQTFLNAYPDGK
jgi:hypothetical protein